MHLRETGVLSNLRGKQKLQVDFILKCATTFVAADGLKFFGPRSLHR